MNNGLQNPLLSFDELYEQARESVPMVAELGKGIIADLQERFPETFRDITFENGPLKTLDRATQKISGDYGGRHQEISDLARGRIVVDTPEQIQAIRDYLNEQANAIGVEKLKDRFANPSDTGFRDINMKVRLENGHVIELRIEHRELLEAAKRTHDPYERVQAIERQATLENRFLTPEEAFERQRLMDEVREIHMRPSVESNLDVLLSDEGRNKLATHEAERIPPSAPARASQFSLVEEFGRRAGVIGGVVVGAALVISGAEAEEVVLGAAEAAVPLVSSAVAASEERFTEALLRGIEEIPIAGLAATEILRPILRGTTELDVDPSLARMALDVMKSDAQNIPPEQIEFLRVFDSLPAEANEHMPPELVSLIEAKNSILETERLIESTPDPLARQNLLDTLHLAENRYEILYNDLTESGSMDYVDDYMDGYEPIPADTILTNNDNDTIQRTAYTENNHVIDFGPKQA